MQIESFIFALTALFSPQKGEESWSSNLKLKLGHSGALTVWTIGQNVVEVHLQGSFVADSNHES